MLPHDSFYTRLKPSPGRGIGVFAIRAIPPGMNPFAGDRLETVRVPRADVDRIDDAEVRRVYVDFCPLVDDAFVAPVDLNLLTISWYMNHSDDPNVTADADANFVTARPIAAGEELTTDYRAFSAHADRLARAWTEPGRANADGDQ